MNIYMNILILPLHNKAKYVDLYDQFKVELRQ